MQVSVVIPVYNAERYVESAVESALQQKETAEVILVEDNSPDSALAVCQRLAARDSRVSLVRHSDGKNHGAGESRNLGIRSARYELVAFLDADDYYLENRFARSAEIFDREPNVDGVYEAVGAEFESEDARQRYFATHYEEVATMQPNVLPEELFRYLVLGGAGYIHLNGLVVRKAGLLKVGLLPKLRLHQDMVLTIKLAAMLKLVPGNVEEPVAVRRLHQDNRITNLKTNFSETQFRALQSLFQWCREKRLPEQQQRLVRDRLRVLAYHFYRGAGNYPLALYYFALSRLFGTR
jgi:glycosyltransferase involved in cell wall biosynthesis